MFLFTLVAILSVVYKLMYIIIAVPGACIYSVAGVYPMHS